MRYSSKRTESCGLVNYDRCLAGDTGTAGSPVDSIDCSDAHQWQVHDDGRVTPADNAGLCLTLAAEREFVNSSIATVPPYSVQGREP